MEIKQINRNYNNFKFKLNNKLDNDHYENLLDEGKYHEMKKILIPYFENKLHVIASHIFMYKYVIPILMLLMLIIFNIDYYYYIVFIIPFFLYKNFKNKWKMATTIYSLELTAINDFINDKYNIDINTDFDEIMC